MKIHLIAFYTFIAFYVQEKKITYRSGSVTDQSYERKRVLAGSLDIFTVVIKIKL